MRRQTIILGAAMLAALGCGRGARFSAEPGTPSHTVERLMKAAETGDVELYLSVLPAQVRAMSEQSRKMLGDQFDALMKTQLAATAAGVKGATVTGEKVTGTRAAVTVKGADGSTADIPCVKEGDKWVLDLGTMGASGMPRR